MLKLSNINGIKVKSTITAGEHSITFDGINFWTAKDTDEIKGCFIQSLEFKDIFIPMSETNLTQFENLMHQLNIETVDLAEIKAKKGTTLKVVMKERKIGKDTYLNADFNRSAKAVDLSAYGL